MANVLVEETSLSNIASAIREKNGGTAVYKPGEMAAAISNLSTGESEATYLGNNLCITTTLPSNITSLSNTYMPSNTAGSLVLSLKSDNITSIQSNAMSNKKVAGFDFPNLTSIAKWGCAFTPQLTQPIVFHSPITLGERALSESNVPSIDFRSSVDLGTYMTFAYDYNLKTFIFRSPELVPLASPGLLNTSGRPYIYVPASLVDEYKNATNWATYSNYIRAIEDYPEITGG